MRNDLINKDYFKGSQFKTCHIYEIELAVLQVLSETTPSTTIVTVDDIDKCYYDVNNPQYFTVAYFDGDSTIHTLLRRVTGISKMLSQITLDSSIPVTKNMFLCETLYTNMPMPKAVYVSDGTPYYKHYLEMNHSWNGSLTGSLLFTDFDLPIIAKTLKPIYNHFTGNEQLLESPALYIPAPIGYKEIGVENKGKMSSVELTIGNVDQLLGAIIFRHGGFKNREIKIKTVFLDLDVTPVSVLVEHTFNADAHVLPSATVSSVDTTINPAMNEEIQQCIYATSDQIILEFSGETNSVSFDGDMASLMAITSVDNPEKTEIPNRIYSRIHCPFTYKGWRCRFNSGMILNAQLNDNDTYMEIYANDKVFYFKDLIPAPHTGGLNIIQMILRTFTYGGGESHILKIDDEYIVIDGFQTVSTPVLDNERIRQMRKAVDMQAWSNQTTIFRLNIKQRAFSGTTKAIHTVNAKVDILTCRKTEHDCMLHGNDAFFGGFPSIPKNKTYGSGY